MSFFLANLTLDLPREFPFESLLPLGVLAGLMVLALILELSGDEENSKTTYPPISGLATIALLGVIGFLFSRPFSAVGYSFQHMLIDDGLSRVVALVVCISLVLAFLAGPAELERHMIEFKGEFYALLLAAGLGMVLMASAANLIVIFLGLELFSLALYLLCIFFPREPRSQESGLKYFILSSAASAFILYGMALVYGNFGSTWLEEMNSPSEGLMLSVGATMILAGLAFKISLVPLHVWTPDVYEGAPTTVTAFMSVATKTAALVVLARVFVIHLHGLLLLTSTICFAFCLLSMLLGNLMALGQSSIKRMLAYSGVAQAGYLLMGIVSGYGALKSMLFYLIVYAFMNVGAFLCLAALEWQRDETITYKSLRGTSGRDPFLAWCFAICLVSLTGLPPTAGFLGKFFLFSTALAEGQAILAVAGIVGSFIGAGYYMRAVFSLFSKSDGGEGEEASAELPTWLALSLALAAAGCLLGGLAPGPVLGWLGASL